MRWLAYLCLRAAGWRFKGSVPPGQNFVAIGAPHTSNWDFIVFLGFMWHLGMKARYLGKESLFRWPMGPIMRRLGGIPVNRNNPNGVIDAAIAAFATSTDMMLVIAPESTRASTSYWRSGFYRIARAADVGVLPAVVDREAKRGTIGGPIHLTGDVGNDMDRIRSFFAEVIPNPPPGMGPIRLGSEIAPPER